MWKGTILYTILTALAPAVEGQWDASRYLYWTTAADSWSSTAPIGNGRVAASIYGGASEQLSLTENSIWSGPWSNRANAKALGALPSIRSLLSTGNLTGAGQSVLENMSGTTYSPRAFHPLGNMTLDFGHSDSSMSSYTRYLDTHQGSGFVTYNYGGINYTREYIASYPHGILAIRLTSSKPHQLNVTVGLDRSKYSLYQYSNISSSIVGSNSITLKGDSGQTSGAITFTSEARVINTKGTVTSDGKSISVTGATTVDIFFNAETSYRYPSSTAWETELKHKLDSAVRSGYTKVRAASIADNTALIGRVGLNLGSSGTAGNNPIPTRIKNYKESPDNDPQLATLMFNFGRHLLVASSRDTGRKQSLAANLQGIWNEDYSPPWQSKYTININIEMNYWPAEHEPGERLWPQKCMGARMAVFMLHHNIDLWGDAAPTDYGTAYMMWPMGGAWLSLHLMEHYRFTGDTAFLKNRAWPVLQSAANFYYCYLFEHDGYYSTGPSLSPENNFIVPPGMETAGATEAIDINPTMDGSILYELFNAVITTCGVLGITGSDLTNAQDYLAKIKPPPIGSKGQILEWRNEYVDASPEHRHMSPVFGLFPGSQMTPLENSTLADAAKSFVDTRMSSGSGTTGWSLTWVINLYARLFAGDTAWNNAVTFLQKFPSDNLWNTDGGPGTAMQIDGNFGFVSAIAEMLLQSHKVVHLLPSLPAAVPEGSVRGLVARGNFVVDITWSGNALKEATITSKIGGALAIRLQDGREFTVDGAAYSEPIITRAGAVYTVLPA
ncbi:hypothetical protein V496_08174 [Pseudogymnoascus sp. VKM F-4515 (FW-2607)]|nr:hypothetical protein V496_08174 [Pseudogymnoascus sp. VKM F-4515 (FW-2607)]KFY90032.1 hypothetical protein V498_06218 [Pseudogymnoascus sp. VKM F-4517 (FW-2822)]